MKWRKSYSAPNPCPPRTSGLVRGSTVVGLVTLVLLAAGCSAHKPEPAVAVPDHFTASGEAPVVDRWWESFNDPALNTLVEQALRENRDLLGAWDRLDQAHAIMAMSTTAMWPNGSANLGYSDHRQHGAKEEVDPALAMMGVDPNASANASEWTLGLTVSYELDLWGRVRSAREASVHDLEAAGEDLRTLAITVSGEVARAWYEEVELAGQLRIMEEQVEVNETYLELLEYRFDLGQAMAAEVIQQREQVESVAGELEMVRMREALTRHRLNVLLGRPPEAVLPVETGELPELPPLPETGLPADLLLRRPDVRSARARMDAADHRVSEAIAAQLPTISIAVGVSDTEEKIESLFDNWVANFSANLLAPLFDAGRRRMEVERTRGAYAESLHNFERSMLNALREVEDALAQESAQAKFEQSLARQEAMAREALKLSRDQYVNGAIDYLPVLINLQSLQRLERGRLEARRTLVEYRIGLYRALAGSWELERPGEGEESK